MGTHGVRKVLILLLIFTLIAGDCLPAGSVEAAVQETEVTPTPEPEQPLPPEVTPTPVPQTTPTPTPSVTPPVVTPAPTPVQKQYVLKSPAAKYKKGGQTGIHYHKVKGKKVYHISSYTTDTVQLTMSHPSTFSIYGGGSKKEVKKKLATVSSKGLVRCHRKGKGEKLYTIVKAVSKTTKEVQYIYIYFQKKISCSTGSKVILYEKYSEQIRIDYPFSKVSISVGNKKKATVSKRGRILAKKHGTTYATIKVRGSQRNQVKIKIIVQKEPWIVSSKDKLYDYDDMVGDLRSLVKKYPGKTGLNSIGTTYDKREIWCLRIGNRYARKKLVINAAIHGREWKNTQVIMRQAEDILRDYRDHKKRFSSTCIYVIPMDNPDGVSISQYGAKALRNKKLQKKCKKLGHNEEWKANARGVNLNNNFPAGFIKKKKAKAHYMKYFGKKAGSEKETKALMNFINEIRPQTVLNLHSTGSILYWDFNVEGKLHDSLYELASKIHSFNGYALMPKSQSTDAAGGFADWLVYKKGITSVTIETGTVPCPLPHSQYKSVYKKNNKMFRWFMTEY